ncbi:MAG TPA: CHAT domain-containing protein [Puia sp.]|jgi:hypothetical protein|nr:CHAT domain-containing protein [Puia sp.]
MPELEQSKAAAPNYQGYFFSLLARNMTAYLGLLGPDLHTQKQYLGDQLTRIVTEKADQLQIANAAITFLLRGHAKAEVRTIQSLARWLAVNGQNRKFFWWIEGEDEDDFLERAARAALDALFPQIIPVSPMIGEKFNYFESYEVGYAVQEDPGAFIHKQPSYFPDDLPSLAEPVEASAEPADVEQRYLNASTREQVRLNEEFGLTVQVDTTLESHGPAEQGALLPQGIQGDITINVHGNGVEFPDGSMKTLHIPALGPSAPLLFRLRATQPGEHRLEITAWNGSAHVAGVTLTIGIDTAPASAGMVQQSTPVILRDPAPGEYALEIVYDKTKEAYRFRLAGEGLDKDGVTATCDPLTDDRKTQYKNLRESLNAQARNESRYTAVQQSIWLRGFGKILAECLVPPVIQANLRRIREKIRQLTIMNDGDDLPWELLYIKASADVGPDADGFFIAELAGACRWRYGAPPPAKIIAIPSILVHPDGSPEYTAGEIANLQQLFPNARVIGKMDDLLTLIAEGKFGMLHFAAHNREASAYSGGSYVPFGASRFDQTLFTGAVPDNAYGASQPLIFMNACTSAGAASLFTEMFSWADRYIRSGAGSFIGSLWEIADQSAPVFALAFYTKLKTGSTLGEAMQAGREAVRTLDPGDPTRLAYTLYGNPQAKVEYV